jgi:hypothetical protein
MPIFSSTLSNLPACPPSGQAQLYGSSPSCDSIKEIASYRPQTRHSPPEPIICSDAHKAKAHSLAIQTAAAFRTSNAAPIEPKSGINVPLQLFDGILWTVGARPAPFEGLTKRNQHVFEHLKAQDDRAYCSLM